MARTVAVTALCAGAIPATAAAATATRTASDLAGAIATDGTTVTGSSFVEIPADTSASHASAGIAAVYGTNEDPQDGTTMAVLSNGTVLGPNDPGGTSDRAGLDQGSAARGGFDVTILRLNLAVAAPANCLAIQFDFFTNDFAVAPTADFADGFFAELDPAAPWSLGASGATSAPDDFAVDQASQTISIAQAFLGMGFNGLPVAQNAVGTGYGGALDWATAVTPVTPGAHVLDLSIFDRGDHTQDSAVLLDNLRLLRRSAGHCPRRIVVGADLVAPTVSMTTPATDVSGTATSATFGGLAGTEDADATSVTLNLYAGAAAEGTAVRTVTAPVSSGAWQATAVDLAPGTYTAQAQQTDDGGNVGVTATRSVTVLDPTTPSGPGDTPPPATQSTPAPVVPAPRLTSAPKRPRLANVVVSGSSLRYTASAAGRLKLKIERLSHGHLRGHTCSLTSHHGRACTKATTVLSKTVSAKSGAGKLHLTKLKRGSYRLTITLTASGVTSSTTTRTFRVT